ncbi:MAG: UbiA family prenyltransferase [Candidatus Eiseniibacteriota bacterium]|jgi:1,4-dihydroxy-2-naphthoate octaprenyltransferase
MHGDANRVIGSLWLFIVHLRLPFQLILAPIFMLGAFLGGALPAVRLLLAFAAVHAGIYGGMTAYNSYYDQDRGPIGTLKHPRAADRFVRNTALVIQLTALLSILVIRPAAAVPAGLLITMGIAYSHPRWRWKRSVWGSLLAVGIGQGLLAFAIGYLCAGADVATLLEPTIVLAALGATLIVVGLYPITQVYQIAEDSARGDRSLAVIVGWRRALGFAATLIAVGVALVGAALTGRVATIWLGALAGGVIVFWLLLYVWSRRFESLDAYRNHDWAMGLAVLASGTFWALIITEWLRELG